MKQPSKARLDVDTLYNGIVKGDRVILGQALTIVESNLTIDQQLSAALLEKILPHTGKSIRIGITGIPGVGKSTFIEAISKHILDESKRVAVLSVDPSSPLTGGSILGDKTRMDVLSKDPRAFIRPTASANILGGVALRTRESILVCEAAGYDVILVETVGVGQSEVAVSNMVDFFLLLMLGGAGDELQGIKKGVVELADAIVITKADGENKAAALKAQAVYGNALHLLTATKEWQPVVKVCSSYTGEGLPELWELIKKFNAQGTTTGWIDQNRRHQNTIWFREHLNHLLLQQVQTNTTTSKLYQSLEQDVINSKITPRTAAEHLLSNLTGK